MFLILGGGVGGQSTRNAEKSTDHLLLYLSGRAETCAHVTLCVCVGGGGGGGGNMVIL